MCKLVPQSALGVTGNIVFPSSLGVRQKPSDYQGVTSGRSCRAYRKSPIELIFGEVGDIFAILIWM